MVLAETSAEKGADRTAGNAGPFDLPVPSRAANLRTLAWLPVISSSGRRLVGLDELFADAHAISRIDVRAPVERAGVLRFLTSVTALVLRASAVSSADSEPLTRTGFDPIAVSSALDGISDRLWLIHESTPFMQEGRYRGASSALKSAASIRSTSPGDASKAWWGRPGDGFATGHLSLLDAPAALAGFWFYSGNGNGGVTLDGVAVVQQGSAAGKVVAAGVRLWKTGENLAATLMMNTPANWVADTALPAWACTLAHSGEHNPIIAGTITGNATLLVPEWCNGEMTFTGAHVGGALRAGIPPTREHNTAIKDAKARNKLRTAAGAAATELEVVPESGVEALKLSLVNAWQSDPQVVLVKADPSKKPLKSGMDGLRAVKDMTAGTTTLHNLNAWYLRAFNPDVPDRGFLRRTHFTSELFCLQLVQKGSYGELSGASWLAMPPGTIGGSLAAQDALSVFAELAYDRVRKSLYLSIQDVTDDAEVTKATLAWALTRFTTLAEDVIEDVIALAVSGQTFTVDHLNTWSKAAMTAFAESIAPLVSARTLPTIATAQARLYKSLHRSESR